MQKPICQANGAKRIEILFVSNFIVSVLYATKKKHLSHEWVEFSVKKIRKKENEKKKKTPTKKNLTIILEKVLKFFSVEKFEENKTKNGAFLDFVLHIFQRFWLRFWFDDLIFIANV